MPLSTNEALTAMLKKFYIPQEEKVHEISDEEFGHPVRHLLMLEDDPDAAGLLREFLETVGYRVTYVPSGVEGLKMIMAVDFDVILCDMLMPKLPGDMFYLAVKRTKPHLCKRFVFMTGHRADPKWDGFIRGINGVMLWKPFQMSDLTETLAKVVKNAEQDERAAVGGI